MIEWLGWGSAIIVLISLVLKSRMWLHILNGAGAAGLSLYAFLTGDPVFTFLNLCMLVVNARGAYRARGASTRGQG